MKRTSVLRLKMFSQGGTMELRFRPFNSYHSANRHDIAEQYSKNLHHYLKDQGQSEWSFEKLKTEVKSRPLFYGALGGLAALGLMMFLQSRMKK
jgi:hypothetical protein